MIVFFVVVIGVVIYFGFWCLFNEDFYMVSLLLFFVVDGMGGYEVGECVSVIVIDEFVCYIGWEDFEFEDLFDILVWVWFVVEVLFGVVNGCVGIMFSGVVVVLVEGMGYWLMVNIGDFCMYCFVDGEFEQISVDYLVVQELIEVGEFIVVEVVMDCCWNIIMCVIGVSSIGDVDYWFFFVEFGDWMFICLDGLIIEVFDVWIEQIFGLEFDLQCVVDIFVDEVVQVGGWDNVMVVVVDVVFVVLWCGVLFQIDDIDVDMCLCEVVVGGVC